MIAANGPLAVAVTKQIARAQADWTVEEGWQRQAELYKPVFESARTPGRAPPPSRRSGHRLARY